MVAGSCRATSMEEARRTGIDLVADFARLDLRELAKQFDVVFDTTGALTLKDAGSLLKRGGVILDTAPPPAKMLRGMISPRYKMVIAKPIHDTLSQIAEMAATGLLRAVIGRVVLITQAIPAIAELEQSGTPKGKLIVLLDPVTIGS